MKMSPNSFFVREFLNIGKYDSHMLPHTVCALATMIAWRSVVMLVKGIFFGLIAWLPVSALLGLIVAMLPGGSISLSGGFLPFGFGMSVCGAVLCGLLVLGAAVGVGLAFVGSKELAVSSWHKLSNATTTSSNSVVGFVVGIYKRVKDKTCVMIEYKE